MSALDRIHGNSCEIEAMRALVRKIATSPARCVLIYGETGTGKGLVARALHELSSRAPFEFVDINCAAIPASLLESELFGHERGAFTGAVGRRVGLIEVADKGTLFLDEVRELDSVLQAKLLTLLDTARFRRIGAEQSIGTDVRFVAATNRILFGEVKAGHFREDLYYRLQVISINLPPLRERGDDVLLLAEHFIERFSRIYGRTIKGMEPSVVEVFRYHRWPGNVRELENLIERIIALEEDDCILASHIPPRIMREVEGSCPRGGIDDGLSHGDFHVRTEVFQRRLIADALKAANGRSGEAARRLGLSRHALRHQMRKLRLLDP
ncbi:MAG: sigma-54 dependent transcriptional regulator [Geminicoccaceae bacterium]